MQRASLFLLLLLPIWAFGQVLQATPGFKADILVVVAHPDDDTLLASYLARAIFDQNKKVAVVYCTPGDSGGNAAGREHARALGEIRTIEARRALATLGITNVWFLDGRDTASQDVLVSLGSWPHGRVLAQTVRIMRLTRPEVVMTWLPSSVAGENHGDHQAAAVIATEAFDVAGSPVVFPEQLALPVRTYETALEGLTPWQSKKLYFFTDAFDDSFLKGKGPAYSIKEISPARKVSYAQLAVQEFGPYYTQSPDPKMNEQIESGEGVTEIVKKVTEGEGAYFTDPLRLMLGESHVKGSVTGDVFEGIAAGPIPFMPPEPAAAAQENTSPARLGGTWGFYHEFWAAHELSALADRPAEIAVRPDDVLNIPLVMTNPNSAAKEFQVSLDLPPGWTLFSRPTAWTVPAHSSYPAVLQVKAPGQLSKTFQEIRVNVQSEGLAIAPLKVYVEVSSQVAAQLH